MLFWYEKTDSLNARLHGTACENPASPPPAPRHDARVAWGCPLNTWSLPPTAVGLLGAVTLTHFGVVDPERRTASWVSELTDTKLRVEDCRTDLAAMLARPRVVFASLALLTPWGNARELYRGHKRRLRL